MRVAQWVPELVAPSSYASRRSAMGRASSTYSSTIGVRANQYSISCAGAFDPLN
jgi:hypothetical protein